KPKKDNDTIKVRCVPNKGGGQCNANPAGGPSELQLVTAASGTDLDNGWTGGAHGFPVVPNSELRVCLTTCDTSSNPQCAEDEAQTAAVNGATFGPPLPLLTTIPPVAPVCVVNRFASTKITGFNANIATGVVSGNVNLLSDVFLTSTTQVCPRCLPTTAAGQVGTCDSGTHQGRACTPGGVVTVQNAAGNKPSPVSADCPPAGAPSGTIPINLPLTTATSTLAGSPPCPGQSQVLPTGCGSCGPASVCTPGSPACVSTTPAGDCVDLKGGINQNCCTNIPTNPCFPTPIVRTGSAAPPTPPFPDPTYPKAGNVTLVATFCEASSGSNLVDFQTGLPGPGAAVVPATVVVRPSP